MLCTSVSLAQQKLEAYNETIANENWSTCEMPSKATSMQKLSQRNKIKTIY